MAAPFEFNGLTGFIHHPRDPGGDALILTHGAGSNANAPLLVNLASAFAENGFLVLRYNLPFRVLRTKGPPVPAHSPRDREGIASLAEYARQMASGRIVAGGHSYGGRQTAMVAAERPDLFSALLLLSYPLHPPGKPDQMRTAFFPSLRTPALFVHGTQDPFGSLEELRKALALISGPVDLMPVEGAKHDLRRAPDLAPEILTRVRALL